jgi:hypothetical protein
MDVVRSFFNDIHGDGVFLRSSTHKLPHSHILEFAHSRISSFMSPEIAQFTPSLFWDVDRETLDLNKNKALIIQRVLERGHDHDWELLKACYTIPEIVQTAMQLRSLEPTALAFVSCIGNVKKEAFRCSMWKQSIPVHWPC